MRPGGWRPRRPAAWWSRTAAPACEAARAAGMRVLAFAGGLSPAELLEGPNTIVFDDMRNLPNLVDQLGTT